MAYLMNNRKNQNLQMGIHNCQNQRINSPWDEAALGDIELHTGSPYETHAGLKCL